MIGILSAKKIALGAILITTVIAAITVPGIFAKISGQHEFIEGGMIKCAACHPGIVDQVNSSSAHAGTLDDGTKWALDCEACHDVGFVSAQGSHAASTISCSECHENQDVAFWHGLLVGGVDARTFFKGSSEFKPPNDCGIECHSTGRDALIGNTPEGELALGSHEEFYRAAMNSTILLHADESCIACHTHAKKTITIPEKAITYNADTNEFGTTPVP